MFDRAMTSAAARSTFSDAIRIFAPDLVVRLGDMPHYGGDASSVEHARLAAGYFYNFSTSLADEELAGLAAEPGPILVPSVRAADRVGLGGSFVRAATHTECIVTLDDAVDACLIARLQSKRARDVRRMARNANYTFEVVESGDIEPVHWADIARLDTLHNARHMVATPMFCEAVQRTFAQSALASAFRWIFRRDASGRVVQAGLILLDHEDGTVYYLHQAIDREVLSSGENLYTATFYTLYCWAQAHGFRAVHLGRNGVDEKKRLGANVFLEQHHWLKAS
ncbi:GNAT family N-acetyltransferase [Burkholderia sp. S-53]|uniref:GNAT family N-acetyltransferase n=1 Tax=Burkholderia sp. S-53 TaxID=2906514 RepID=UPI0021D0F9BB|nr:GNAT family N-acetyltransferase [Burkholderia sp. S-53]UXU85564.1 GNAT family N-acetyltransferase [Burkholderia sp. S-53]